MAISSNLKEIAEEFLDSNLEEEVKSVIVDKLDDLEGDFDHSIGSPLRELDNKLNSLNFSQVQRDKIITKALENLSKNY